MKKVSRRHISTDKARLKTSSASSISETFELTIDRMAFGGSGVGRYNGKVVFVPFSAPGDLIKVRTTADHKTYFEAEIIEILTPSKSRIPPKCEVFGRCGGCSWQHLSYEEQLNQKFSIVQNAFIKKSIPVLNWLPIVGCEKSWAYRNRIQLQVQSGKIGYFARKSHELVAISECPIAEENINKFIQSSSKNLRDGRVEISLNALLEPHFRFSEDDFGSYDFSQVNRFQNTKLIDQVLAASSAANPSQILDLYAGSGNFTFPLLEVHKKASVRAVELSSASVKTAHQKILRQDLSPKKLSFFCADVESFLVRQRLSPTELVLLDPPRSGCSDGVVKNLAQQPIKSAIYISCNPMTLVRDLALWKTLNPNLRVLSVQAFDMFPQTDHVEVLVTLSIDTALGDANL